MNGRCFVIMPFRPELSFLYRYVKEHVEGKFEIECVRGDGETLTVPLLDKIRDLIDSSDFVIADISGRNPNVFYELGLAHASNKEVILITHDTVEDAPTDIRSYEFIRYADDHGAFLAKLNSAIRSLIQVDYEALYAATRELFDRFCADRGISLQRKSKDRFIDGVTNAFSPSALPAPDEAKSIAKKLIMYMLPELDVDVVASLSEWIEKEFD